MRDEKFIDLLANFGVPPNMIDRASIGFKAHLKPLYQLLEQRTLPDQGWDDSQIKLFLYYLSHLDSDKDPGALRIGEREGRFSSDLLGDLSGGFFHGIGRSGNLTAPQPKAAGASIMQKITNKIVLSLIKSLGLTNIKAALTVPFGTGMSIGLALRGLVNHYNVDFKSKPLVMYPQLDHKSPVKGIEFVGGDVCIIPGKFGKNYYAPDGVYVDIEDIKQIYHENSSQISSIVSNTTFFAPRVPDDIKEIAKFAKQNNIIHIINNAYGVQVPSILKDIGRAIDAGRVDAIVQSTDKNFLVPVGGAVIVSPDKNIVKSISHTYAGRASASPIIQLLVSLLSLGKQGYHSQIKQQQENFQLLKSKLVAFSKTIGEEVLECNNHVSCAMTLKNLPKKDLNELGGKLYNLRITGPRIIIKGDSNYGACLKELPFSYIVMNAAIGSKAGHISESISRLQKAILKIKENS
jgi:O-phospho-L-seryl-tRNASec:L-selenocysteinyl-tRNA synthase